MNAANLDSTIDCDEAVKFARELTLINRDLARNQAAPNDRPWSRGILR